MVVPGFLVVLLLTCLVGCSSEEQRDGTDKSDPSTPVAGYEVQPRDLSKSVRVSGTVEPVERYRIKAYDDGILSRLDVEEGDEVREGELLAATELAEYRAELKRVQAEVERLERRLNRREPLVEQDAVREAEIEEIRADLEVARREADVWKTRIDLGELRAPAEAIVTDRHVDPGSSVAANEKVLELADVSNLVIPVRLSERDVVDIDEDQSVAVRFDAYPDESVDGKIRRIFPAVDAESRRVTVEIELSELSEQMEVRPGFRARATIEVDRRPEMVAVPGESLLASEGDDEFVYVIENNELVRRSVETGVDRRNWTEITEGLAAGETVVGMNPTNLREAMRVHVSQWIDPEKL